MFSFPLHSWRLYRISRFGDAYVSAQLEGDWDGHELPSGSRWRRASSVHNLSSSNFYLVPKPASILPIVLEPYKLDLIFGEFRSYSIQKSTIIHHGCIVNMDFLKATQKEAQAKANPANPANAARAPPAPAPRPDKYPQFKSWSGDTAIAFTGVILQAIPFSKV